MNATKYFAYLFLSFLIAVLSACSSGDSEPASPTNPNVGAGWITITSTVGYPDEARLGGEAFVSPTWSRCCSGSAEDTGVTVTWLNMTTNASGLANQRVVERCSVILGCYIADHYWYAYIPIVPGDNHIQMTAADPSGNIGYAQTTVAPGPPPPDTIAPTITFTSPQDNATDVGVNTVVTAIFSEPMDPATITTSNFILSDSGGTPVPGSVTYADTTATYTPTTDLAYSSQYTVRINQNVQDLAGNHLASDYIWTFTTGIAPDTTPPTVISVTPKDNELCADPDAWISASFSEPISAATATTSSFIVSNATGDPIPGNVWASGSVMYFDPSLGLAYNAPYSATVTTDVMDLAGNALGSNYSWTFSTQPTVSGAWQAISDVSAPQSREGHTTIWTGTEMIIWGGNSINGYLNTGGRYDPANDLWQSTSTTGAPVARRYHTAVWTGSEMIVWGGLDWNGNYLNTGARYAPDTDTWHPLSTTGAPSARRWHTAVWTGSEMIVWGGIDANGKLLNDGAQYDPVSDTWQPISTTAAPSARYFHTAVWTGSEMIVWGGTGISSNIGGRYNPSNDTWQPISTTAAPSQRVRHTAVWTGSEMIVWGGYDGAWLSSGGIYDPVANSWRSTSQICPPTGRILHTAVWSGTQMIIWGGQSNGANLNSGGAYDLSSDSWHATQFLGAPPAMSGHTAIWTGSQMIIWGANILSPDPGTGDFFTP